MLIVQILLALAAVVSLMYTLKKRDRRPLERGANILCAAIVIYFSLFTVW